MLRLITTHIVFHWTSFYIMNSTCNVSILLYIWLYFIKFYFIRRYIFCYVLCCRTLYLISQGMHTQCGRVNTADISLCHYKIILRGKQKEAKKNIKTSIFYPTTLENVSSLSWDCRLGQSLSNFTQFLWLCDRIVDLYSCIRAFFPCIKANVYNNTVKY